jgi:glutathione synthase/RimK-type ligase-like ATP-grasp enzyme
MKNVITIKPSMDTYSELIIHPAKATEIDLGKRKFACISFGNQKHYVNIRITDELSPENILLSQKLIEALHLPDYPVYEISLTYNEILIGPYIGLLLSNEDNKLTTSRLNKMLVYVSEYAKLHGAVVVFALNKVDPANRLIEGYCYNPIKNCWQRGLFPYPSSIYRTIGLSAKWKNYFLSAIGDNIFNSRYFNKWEMHQWFSNVSDLNHHIPYTLLYHSPQDVLDMLERFQKIYIKPVSGLQGRGIVRISMENELFIFKYHENRVICKVTLKDLGKVREYIQKRFVHGRYLIQQAIELLEYEGGIIDFRCVVQKNQSNAWVCMAIIGRYGAKDSIVSNISSGGAAFPVEEMLGKVIATSAENIFDWKKKIETLAIDVCNTLDKYGINCGTLGLDIGIDTLGRLWLIEINNRDPDPTIALDVHDEQLYHTLKTGPLFYAKLLAGFNLDLNLPT